MLLAVFAGITGVALLFGGGASGIDTLATPGPPTVGVAMEVAQIRPDCVPGTNCQSVAYVVKVLCGRISPLGAGTYHTEINVYNLADLLISPILFQVVATGGFGTTGGTVSPNVARTITGRAAIRMQCSNITDRIGRADLIGFVRIQPPATTELAVTAVWTRTL
jgi:hypothetical protein